MATPGAFSWNSELPSGHNPYWIRDSALVGLGLQPGDAVAVDTRGDPADGDFVVADIEIDGDSQRIARRYVALGERVRLEPAGDQKMAVIELPAEQVMVMGVIVARVLFDRDQATEEPLALG
jgi:SOS-response transcriptional repressor LexA